jgi:hypothetical protein
MSKNATDERLEKAEATEQNLRWANVGSVAFAVAQSICGAVLAISGFRLLIGLGALAAAGGILTPLRRFHQDAIRIPMMALALAGAAANIYSVWRVRSLRARPAAQWRMRTISPQKIRSERLQLALSGITLVLLAAEWIMHTILHRAR